MTTDGAEVSTEGPPTRWYLSTDRHTLYVNFLRDGKTATAVVRWEREPTEEMIASAVENVRSTDTDLADGERWRIRRIGNTVFDLNTGPPTWWYPRIRIDRTSRGKRSLQVGWLRAAVGVWRAAPRTSD